MGTQFSKHFYIVCLFFLVSTVFSFINPLMIPILVANGSQSAQTASIIQTIAFLCAGIFQPILGRMIDSKQFKLASFSIAACILFGLGSFCIGNPMFITMGMVFFSIGFVSLFTMTIFCLVGCVHESKRTKAFTIVYMILNIGGAISGLIAYLFMGKFKQQLIAIDLITTILATLVIFLTIHLSIKNNNFNYTFKKEKISFRDDIIPKWHLFLGLIFLQIPMFSHVSIFPLYFSEKGLDAQKLTSLIFIVNTAFIIVCAPIVSKIFEKMGISKTFFIGMFFLAIGQAIFPTFLNNFGIFSSTVLWTIGELIILPKIVVFIYSIVGEDKKGLASGINTGLLSIAKVMNPLFGLLVLKSNVVAISLLLFAIPIIGYALTSLDYIFKTKRTITTATCVASE
ncbi:MAG: MFS transporter [Oligoflexia bacterium]|nr:MFS transporter [Oligoflexia bacterium]